MGRNPAGARGVDEAIRVRAVARAEDEQEVDLGQHRLDRALAVRRRVADVVLRRALDSREPPPQGRDDRRRVVDRERRLRQVGEAIGLRRLDALRILERLDEEDRVGRLARRADHLLVPRVPDQDDRVAASGVVPRFGVDFRHERAGGVDRPQPA
jgi:hypothetical protein